MPQWADRLVEILALYLGRQEICVVPPKMHERFRIGLPKMHLRNDQPYAIGELHRLKFIFQYSIIPAPPASMSMVNSGKFM